MDSDYIPECSTVSLQWRHNGHDAISNHQPHDCLLNLLSGLDQRKNQSSASLAFVWEIHQWLVNSSHKWPIMRKMFPFDNITMLILIYALDACFWHRSPHVGWTCQRMTDGSLWSYSQSDWPAYPCSLSHQTVSWLKQCKQISTAAKLQLCNVSSKYVIGIM